jgi:transposase InsO family protein
MPGRSHSREFKLERPTSRIYHHSDRGVQYASHEFIHTLELAGARISIAANGNPYDNAKAESFVKTLKRCNVEQGALEIARVGPADCHFRPQAVYRSVAGHNETFEGTEGT